MNLLSSKSIYINKSYFFTKFCHNCCPDSHGHGDAVVSVSLLTTTLKQFVLKKVEDVVAVTVFDSRFMFMLHCCFKK